MLRAPSQRPAHEPLRARRRRTPRLASPRPSNAASEPGAGPGAAAREQPARPYKGNQPPSPLDVFELPPVPADALLELELVLELVLELELELIPPSGTCVTHWLPAQS